MCLVVRTVLASPPYDLALGCRTRTHTHTHTHTHAHAHTHTHTHVHTHTASLTPPHRHVCVLMQPREADERVDNGTNHRHVMEGKEAKRKGEKDEAKKRGREEEEEDSCPNEVLYGKEE